MNWDKSSLSGKLGLGLKSWDGVMKKEEAGSSLILGGTAGLIEGLSEVTQ